LEGNPVLRLTEGIALDDSEVEERFVRVMGPGGQNVRKEETAVELRFDIGASSLPPDVKGRLMAFAGRTVIRDGILVVVSRVHRSQVDNREAARARLIALLQRAAKPLSKRRPTKPRRAVREERLASKKRRGAVKQSRRRRSEE
jgi:ribosome-associated protein